ncbi:plexin-A4-like [Diadema antillarum]|uniref:plexin-A4-like n=1 Tax=Diadema antillarum TaxID=105358 RepID=UPI003A8720BF
MYAVFTKENSSPVQSALCHYKMSDIQQRFTDAVVDCITCSPSKSRQCQATEGNNAYYAYPNGVNPLTASPVLTFSDVEPTSIITTTERDYTVAFIGSSEGELLKIHILNDSSAYQYENIPLGQGSVLRDVFLDEDEEQIILATGSEKGSQVFKLSLANCSNFMSCEECIGPLGEHDGDPYCGWCTLEARCTRFSDCPLGQESTRWLPYDTEPCASISEIQPSDKIIYDQPEQSINIAVEQLPELFDGNQYICVFDVYQVQAVTSGNTISCVTPPANVLPLIPDGEFRLVSSFVFHYKDVPLASLVPGRVIGVSTRTDNPLGIGNRGQEFCPHLLGVQEEILVPVGVNTVYTLLAKHLPTDQRKVGFYECVLDVEGAEQAVRATHYNESQVSCDGAYSYNEKLLLKSVHVSVRWNGNNNIDDVTGSQVILYKCSVNSESCSRCLSPEVTPARLGCGWCENDCNVAGSEVCLAIGFLNQNMYLQCNGPVITSIFPASGPPEGNTRLEIRGKDLGLTFSHITKISIGDSDCDITNMEILYEPGLR